MEARMVKFYILYFLLIFSVDGMCAAKSNGESIDVDWKDLYEGYKSSHGAYVILPMPSLEESLDFEKKIYIRIKEYPHYEYNPAYSEAENLKNLEKKIEDLKSGDKIAVHFPPSAKHYLLLKNVPGAVLNVRLSNYKKISVYQKE